MSVREIGTREQKNCRSDELRIHYLVGQQIKTINPNPDFFETRRINLQKGEIEDVTHGETALNGLSFLISTP